MQVKSSQVKWNQSWEIVRSLSQIHVDVPDATTLDELGKLSAVASAVCQPLTDVCSFLFISIDANDFIFISWVWARWPLEKVEAPERLDLDEDLDSDPLDVLTSMDQPAAVPEFFEET